MLPFGIEVELSALDIKAFEAQFPFPLTNCAIMDFSECASEGQQLSSDGFCRHIEGCIRCSADFRRYWHIIREMNVFCEITSPILSSLSPIAALCNSLKLAGAGTDNACGLHVHINARQMSFSHILRLLKAYQQLEKEIDGIMTPERRLDHCEYAHTLTGFDFSNVSSLGQLSSAMSHKSYKVNIQSLGKYGTIEFRHHHGTTDYAEITNWVMFLQKFCSSETPETTML